MAERTPRNERSPLARPLEWLTRQIVRAPGLVFGAGVALALLSVLVTVNGLTFKTSRLDLLSPRSEYNQRWLAYLDEFGDRDDAVLVIRGTDEKQVTAAVDDLGRQLRERPDLFDSVLDRLNFTELKAKGLHFLSPAELHKLSGMAQQASVLVPREGASVDPVEAFQKCNDQWERIDAHAPQVRQQMERAYAQLAGRLLAAMDPQAQQQLAFAGGMIEQSQSANRPATYTEPTTADALTGGLSASSVASMPKEPIRYLLSDEGQMAFVLLKLKVEEGEFARGDKAIQVLRHEVDEARERHPGLWIGLTGMPIIEHDEMQASQADMAWTNILSFIAVAAIFIAGYGGWRHAVLTNIVLLLAMAYSFAFVTLWIGHLNILSAAFGAVLIGLGIDYGSFYVSYYLKLVAGGMDVKDALVRSSADVGPGIVTGGTTTAAAFFMAGLTEFTGVRELGIVAGGGIVLCIFATVLFLPALVLIVDRRWPSGSLPVLLPAARWFGMSIRYPRTVFMGCLGVTALLGTCMVGLRYDHNLLNLQPRHIESVDIERELFTERQDSVWFAVSICPTREELRRRKAMFDQMPTVAKTEEIVTLLPESSADKQRAIVNIGSATAYLPQELPPLAPLRIGQLRTELQRAMRLLSEAPYESPSAAMVMQLGRALSQMPDDQAGPLLAARLTELSQKSLVHLQSLRGVTDPLPPQLDDLPSELTDRFVGRTQQHLLRVYAKGNIWDMASLRQFVADVEYIDPQVTGHPVQTYYASRHMQQSFVHAGIYALIVVFGILMLDFRSIRVSLLAMVPLTMGFVQMCGLIAWLEIPFNAANMISLALILGIGVDVGVHLTHEMQRQRGRFKLTDSTTVALLITESTTIASFGAMILARHQGLRSLGQVLTLGVTCCLASSIIAFPALLRWITSGREDIADEDEDSMADGSGDCSVGPALALDGGSLTLPVEMPAVTYEPVEWPDRVIEHQALRNSAVDEPSLVDEDADSSEFKLLVPAAIEVENPLGELSGERVIPRRRVAGG